MSPAAAPVKPRIVSPETGETILLEEALLDWIDRRAPRVLQIIGGCGAGKTTALEHLAAVCPAAHGLEFLDDVDGADVGTFSATSVVVCSSTHPSNESLAADDVRQCWLAPWSKDEFIEYLLAVHPQECRSVMARIQSAPDPDILAGNAELSRLVLDRMAANEAMGCVTEALLAELDSRIDDLHLKRRVAEFAVEFWTERRQTEEMLNAFEFCDPGLRRFLRHRPVQQALVGLAAHHVLEAIRAGEHWHVLKLIAKPNDALVSAIGRILDGDARGKLIAVTENRLRRDLHGAAASILIAADPHWRPQKPRRVRLARACLAGAQWREMNLSKQSLSGVNFTRADLRDANLRGAFAISARFREAHLERASLESISADRACFTNAYLCDVRAAKACMRGANFERADLSGGQFNAAIFEDAKLSNALFCRANLTGANLHGAEIEDADFSNADLQRACLAELKLSVANFSGARFPSAVLCRCDLEFMQLPDANFESADLTGAWLTGSVIPRGNFRNAKLRQSAMADIDWAGAVLRGADLRGCTFHMGSSRSGLLFTSIASEGTRTGFYTDDFSEQHFKSPEEIRKANLCGADLRDAIIEGVDFYLVDLRGAKYTEPQKRHFEKCRAILRDLT